MENFAEQCLDMACSILSQNLDAIDDNGTIKPFPNENAILTGLSDGSVFLSEIEKASNTIIIRSFTEFEVSAIAVTKDCSHLLIGDMGGNILWTSIWDEEKK